MENKELLLAALEAYPEITFSQKNILKVLINLESEANIKTLMDILKLTRQSIYPNLKKLQEIQLIYSEKRRTQFFGIKHANMPKVIEFYKNKQKALQSINKTLDKNSL